MRAPKTTLVYVLSVAVVGCGDDAGSVEEATGSGTPDTSSSSQGDTSEADTTSAMPQTASGSSAESSSSSSTGGASEEAGGTDSGSSTDSGPSTGSGPGTDSGSSTGSETSTGSGSSTDSGSSTGSGSSTTGGEPGQLLDGCDITLDPETPITFIPSQVVVDDADVLYLFDNPNNRIYRWSADCGAAYPVIDLGPGAYAIAYASSHLSLYVGYSLGDITAIDLTAGTDESPFATLTGDPLGLAVAGDYVVAVDTEGAWESHYTFDSAGMLIDAVDWNHPSPEYVWSAANERLYFFRQGSSPNDLHWERIDQSTGFIVDEGESPYHGAYTIVPPIRVSDDGAYVLLGNGHVYDGVTLERPDAMPANPVDAAWIDGTFVTISGGTDTLVERWDPDTYFERIDAALYPGVAAALARTSLGLYVLSMESGALAFTLYEAGEDGDGDGVGYVDDDFPTDPAASIDSDYDGAPDAWNPGAGPGDSTTGLVIDEHPQLAACTTGLACDLQAQSLLDPPTGGFVDLEDVVHLLSPADRKILRWSSELEEFLDPIVIGAGAELVAYDPSTDSAFVSHDSGWVAEIALGGELVERHWRTLPEPAHGLAMAGAVVLAADATGAWNTHYTFDVLGGEISRVDWNQRSSAYAWNPVISRIYFFRDGSSPNDLLFEEVDQVSGAIVDEGESPYHGMYSIAGPIAVSPNGSFVMIGTGQVYDAVDLNHITFLPEGGLVDILWAADHILTARTDGADGTTVERWSLGYALEASQNHSGEPFRLFDTAAGEVVVTLIDGQPQFTTF